MQTPGAAWLQGWMSARAEAALWGEGRLPASARSLQCPAPHWLPAGAPNAAFQTFAKMPQSIKQAQVGGKEKRHKQRREDAFNASSRRQTREYSAGGVRGHGLCPRAGSCASGARAMPWGAPAAPRWEGLGEALDAGAGCEAGLRPPLPLQPGEAGHRAGNSPGIAMEMEIMERGGPGAPAAAA